MIVLTHKSSRQAPDVPDATKIPKQQYDISPASHLLIWESRPLDSICWCYLYVADFIFVPCCQDDKVAGVNLKIVSFAVIFATVLADVGVLLVALVVRQPCICKHESVRRIQNRGAYTVISHRGNKAKT